MYNACFYKETQNVQGSKQVIFPPLLREMSYQIVSVCFVVISIGRVGPKINHG